MVAGMWRQLVPVSYTHLDVYKRQPLSGQLLSLLLFWWPLPLLQLPWYHPRNWLSDIPQERTVHRSHPCRLPDRSGCRRLLSLLQELCWGSLSVIHYRHNVWKSHQGIRRQRGRPQGRGPDFWMKQYLSLIFCITFFKMCIRDRSNTRALTSRTVISMYPFFKKHRDDLFELFNMVKTGGVKSLLSVRGGTLINNLRKGWLWEWKANV